MVIFYLMGYAQALEKAWQDVIGIAGVKHLPVKLLSDTYDVDTGKRAIVSGSCGGNAKDYTAIIILHYLFQRLALKGRLPEPAGEWIDFNQLEGGEGYYPAFRKRTIGRVISKYGSKPDELLKATDRMPAKPAGLGDASVIVYPFAETPVLIKVSKADEEFGPDANILFDRNMPKIFCTEDIVVLTEIIVHQL